MEFVQRCSSLQAVLEHPRLSDFLINNCHETYADLGEGLQSIESPFDSEEAVKAWVLQCMKESGLTWNARYPFVDFGWREHFRIHAVFPPISAGTLRVSIRKHRVRAWADNPWNQDPWISFAKNIVKNRENLIISGATGSGKTTLMEYLLSQVPVSERILSIEDSRELTPRHPHHIALCVRKENADGFGEIQAEQILKEALRMRPDRLVLGECRGPEVLQLLQALNTGHQGSMGTLHANSCREALRRLEVLSLWALQSGSPPLRWIRELISGSLQWILQVEKSQGIRRISQICKVEGLEGDVIILRPLVK